MPSAPRRGRLRHPRKAAKHGPRGLPSEVASKLTAALKKVYDSPAFKDFMTARGFGTVWRDASQFEAFIEEADRQTGQAMKAAGFAKAS